MARSAAANKLAKYRSMRDFNVTSEPSGAKARARAKNSFVIQKHAARRLHYDFRLELDGVLLSWSVPKGPSLSPKERRLAVRTEDHPLDYADFEGIIPAGQYGGGTVVVWDRGTWQPEGDAQEAMKKGRLTFTLDGEKLHGRWHLIRTKGGDKNENWLLFKSRDEAADEELDITTDRPESVLSGRTVEQIAAAPDRVWQSNRVQEPTVAQKRAARIATAKRAEVAKPATSVDELLALVSKLPLGYKLTNLDKVLYPEQGITKGQLIAYLAVVADWMLPHVANRPLTIVRCPEGRKKPCFFQKHILAGSPKAIHALPIEEEKGEMVDYMSIADMPGLVALAQLGTLEIHTWGSHADKPEKPDLMVFDLDPDTELPWDRVALAAFDMRRRLNELGFTSFLKTTGGKGLHVVAPIERRQTWDEIKAFTKAVVERMERDAPQLYTSNMGKVHRRGKIFVDYLRNQRNATFIAPYSPRARDGAPVAVPITWEELAHGVDPLAFNTATVPRRLANLESDPWKGINDIKQAITAATWKAVGGKP
ncbi:MAG TPA: non-homologous end-joining DNA ligase [Kofleriaceae bacterium]|nr:non-homologous end-joining DNA ligase [Kofleriaceae bacterium]